MAHLQISRIFEGLGNVEKIPMSNDRFTLNGRVDYGDDDIQKSYAIRDQILNLKGADEMFVPLRVREDPTLDRAVRVVDASCDLESGGMQIGRHPWNITVEPVPGGSLPNVESPLLGGLRANGVGMAYGDVTPWHAMPAGILDYYDGAGAFVPIPTVIATETGDVNYYRFISGVGMKTARAGLPIGNWYDGAACIEQTYPDGVYYCPTGRHLRSGLGASGWRIGNGIVRFGPAAGGRITMEFFDDGIGDWGAIHTFRFQASDGITYYNVDRINTVAVMKNTPEECRVKISLGLESGGTEYQQRTMLTIRVRRGARVGEFRWHMPGDVKPYGVGPDPTEAGAALGAFAAGGYTTTPDAQGNLAALFTPVANTFSTGTSFLSPNVLTNAWSFGLGPIRNGTFAATPWAVGDLRKEYFAPYGERMTVVGW